MNQKITPQNKDQILQLHRQGKSSKEIAVIIGVSNTTIWEWSKKLNIKFSDIENHSKSITPEELETIKDLYHQGFGERRIAKKIDIKRGRVQRAFRMLGVFDVGKRNKDQLHSLFPNEKKCKRCLIVKPIDQFTKHTKIDEDKIISYMDARCISCEKIYQREKSNLPENKIQRNEYQKEKKKKNPIYHLRIIVAQSIVAALKSNGSNKKNTSCMKYLPYTIEQLRDHLESLFSHPTNLTPNGKVWM